MLGRARPVRAGSDYRDIEGLPVERIPFPMGFKNSPRPGLCDGSLGLAIPDSTDSTRFPQGRYDPYALFARAMMA
jgi:hypothetical protein